MMKPIAIAAYVTAKNNWPCGATGKMTPIHALKATPPKYAAAIFI